MIRKRTKLYSNGVKIAIFLRKITNIAQNDPMASGGGCLPEDPCILYVTCLVAPVYSGRRLNDVFDQFFLKLEFNPPFSSARFSLRLSIFAQMNGCHIFEEETQNRIIREPHFLLNLSQKKKIRKNDVYSLLKNCNFARILGEVK